jgi:hypothetical protein
MDMKLEVLEHQTEIYAWSLVCGGMVAALRRLPHY